MVISRKNRKKLKIRDIIITLMVSIIFLNILPTFAVNTITDSNFQSDITPGWSTDQTNDITASWDSVGYTGTITNGTSVYSASGGSLKYYLGNNSSTSIIEDYKDSNPFSYDGSSNVQLSFAWKKYYASNGGTPHEMIIRLVKVSTGAAVNVWSNTTKDASNSWNVVQNQNITSSFSGAGDYKLRLVVRFGNSQTYGSSNQTSGWFDEVFLDITDTTPPAAPTGLTVTNEGSGDKLNLSWSSNTESDLLGYNVYRSSSSGGAYTKINSSLINQTNYTDSSLTAGLTYYYKISAVDNNANESSLSGAKSGLPADTQPPTVPTGLLVSDGGNGGQLDLSWTASSDYQLSGYNVYRSTNANGTFVKVNSSLITSTSFSDTGLTNNTLYYYKVSAVDTSGNQSALSNPASGTPTIDTIPPAAPLNLQIRDEGTGGKLQISWDPNVEPDLSGYDVYMATTKTGVYGKLNQSLISATSYLSTGLTNGTSYWYKLKAIDTRGNVSIFSEAKSGTPNINPAAPQELRATPYHTGEKLGLTWKQNSELDLLGYNLYRSLTPNGTFSKVNTNVITEVPILDSGLNQNTTYYYKVQAIDLDGNLSDFSAVVSGTTEVIPVEPPHGKFQTNTRLCGKCHQAHQAPGSSLLRKMTIRDLCFSCHDGTQSNYNVKSGLFWNGTQDVPSLAGGFEEASGFTSKHLIQEKNIPPGGSGAEIMLTCTSCHNPHGTDNYRNLKTTVNGKSNISVVGQIAGPGRTVPTAGGQEVPSYSSGVVGFCTACHLDYSTYNSNDTDGGVLHYRHRMNVSLEGGTGLSYPTPPGLLTTLPTEGTPSGARITDFTKSASGNLATGIYNYVVTAQNPNGESKRGNGFQVQINSTGSVTISWEAISNATGYRIYRNTRTTDPETLLAADFNFLAEVADNITSFTDNGSFSEDINIHPPTNAVTQVICLTCHKAHGTKATNESGNTKLRRLDNMGVCQNCHRR